jgi:hypothetical protein
LEREWSIGIDGMEVGVSIGIDGMEVGIRMMEGWKR